MLPALVDLSTFEVRIPGGIAAGDTARAEGALDDASALVRAEAGKTWATEVVGSYELDDDIPDVIRTVVISAAKRAFINPDGVRAESIDNYRTDYATASPDVYLTSRETALVRQAAGKTGLWTQPTTRGEMETDTIYVEVDPPGEKLPLLSREPF